MDTEHARRLEDAELDAEEVERLEDAELDAEEAERLEDTELDTEGNTRNKLRFVLATCFFFRCAVVVARVSCLFL